MTFSEYKKKAEFYTQLFLLEKGLPYFTRKKYRSYAIKLFILGFVGHFFLTHSLLEKVSTLMMFTSVVAFLWLFLFECMYRSFIYRKNRDTELGASLALLFLESKNQKGLVRNFFSLPVIRWVHQRIGATEDDVSSFLSILETAETSHPLPQVEHDICKAMSVDVNIERHEEIELHHFAHTFITVSEEFARFIFSYGLTIKEYIQLIRLSESTIHPSTRTFWWMEENLLRRPFIGRDWAFGKIHFLEEYGRVVDTTIIASAVIQENVVERVETILSRERETNIVLVGETSEATEEIVHLLAGQINRGTVPLEITGFRLVTVNAVSLSLGKNKNELETTLLGILNETINAGNVVLALTNFSSLYENAHKSDVDVVELIEPYLAGGKLKIVVTCPTMDFHKTLETNSVFMKYFEKVEVPEADQDTMFSIAWNTAIRLEEKNPLFFSYQAIKAVVHGAFRHFSGQAEDEIMDIFANLVSYAKKNKKSELLKEKTDEGRVVISEALVSEELKTMTGIPQGALSQKESTKLIGLTDELHKRVIGQEEALNAIANALKRSRAGVGSNKRPLGSFLFLGPTGVGKTETAKALADIFFEGENRMIRLDMSEYKTQDSLSRLIGSQGNPGVLALWARERPYGVLLLDEFEKTSKDVQDLFLQILDEGIFTDGSGIKVNMRDMIIVATTNAGSDVIFEWTTKGLDIKNKKDELIKEVISRGIFKPELVNRFDAPILYKPLSPKELRSVAGIMLNKLEARLIEKGFSLHVTDELLDFLVTKGNDPLFGARAMNRAIQDTIENYIADKIIRGHISKGEKITIDVQAITQNNLS